MRRHSILLSAEGRNAPRSHDDPTFRDGLALAESAGGDLLGTLFSVRGRQIGASQSPKAATIVSPDTNVAVITRAVAGRLVPLPGRTFPVAGSNCSIAT